MPAFQAIVTKYKGPTNHNPAKIIAKASAGSVTHFYDAGLSQEDNHDMAAKKLAHKMKWSGLWHRGGMPTGDGNVYVCTIKGYGTEAFEFSCSEG